MILRAHNVQFAVQAYHPHRELPAALSVDIRILVDACCQNQRACSQEPYSGGFDPQNIEHHVENRQKKISKNLMQWLRVFMKNINQ